MIFDLIGGLLTELDIPFYENQPEFKGNSPEQFITYSLYDIPQFYGAGVEMVTRYHITFNIYTTGTNYKQNADDISINLTALLLDNGFVRQGGSCAVSNDFPKYYHKAAEFIYDYEI